MRNFRTFTALGGVAGLSVAAAMTLAAPSALADDAPTGSAYAASVQATLLNAVNAAAGPLPVATYPAGDDNSVVKLGNYNDMLLKAHLLNASSLLDSGTLTSAASIADVNALGLISAKLITATCVANASGVEGSAKLVDLVVAGKPIDVTAPNLPNEIKVGNEVIVRINEQIRQGDTLTVNALHVIVGGKIAGVAQADVVLSQAACTAGGKILPPPPTATTIPPTKTSSPTTVTPTTSGAPSTTVPPQAAGGTPPSQGGLPVTGVNAILPLSLGGLALLGAGGAALHFARRRRAASAGTESTTVD
jgi:hypothetical protein